MKALIFIFSFFALVGAIKVPMPGPITPPGDLIIDEEPIVEEFREEIYRALDIIRAEITPYIFMGIRYAILAVGLIIGVQIVAACCLCIAIKH